MEKKDIIERLNKGKNYTEIEAIAEKLVYELIPIKKRAYFRVRFNSLEKKDLEKLGFVVFEIGIRNAKQLIEKLKKEGFLYTYDCYFHLLKKEVWSIREGYYTSLYVSIENENFSKLITKEQYIDLVADKILKMIKEWQEYKKFVNSLIEEEKDFYETQLEEEKKQEIIEKALEEARKKGFIK